MKFRGFLLGLVLLGLASCGTRTIRDPGDDVGPLVGVWDSMAGDPATCHERLVLNGDFTFWWFDKSGDFSGTFVLSEDQLTFLFAGGKSGELVQYKVDAQVLEVFRAGVQTRYTKVPLSYANKMPCPSDRPTPQPKICSKCSCKSTTSCKTTCKTTCKRPAGKIQETFVPLDTASLYDEGLGAGDRCEATRDLEGSLGLLCWNPKPPPPPPPPPQPPVPPPPCPPPPPVPTPTPQPPVPCTNASCTSINNNTNNNTNTNTNTNPVNVNINISGGTCTNCPTPTPTVTPTPPCPSCPDCPPPSPKQKPPKPQPPCPDCPPCPPVEDDCCCCDCCEETCTTTTTTTCSCQ